MVIEIKGVGQGNKGAEMMMLTMMKQLSKYMNDIKFVISPKPGDAEYSFYSKYGLYPKLPMRYKGFNVNFLFKLIPSTILKTFGIVKDNEIDVILDASGFSYSSQWGDIFAKNMAYDCKRWKKNGKKVILLPQSFGPFYSRKIKNYMREIIEYADLIYARDEYSFNELNKIKKDKKIKLYPDFTVLFKGIAPPYIENIKNKICLVPNMRMIDKTNKREEYISFFINVIEILKELSIEAMFLIHGGTDDKKLLNIINSNFKLEVIEESNPYFIKGIIENSKGLIGSRYHSIASALYSNIPVFGTGWSHKYEYLFSDFDYLDGLININISKDNLKNKLSIFRNSEEIHLLKSKLKKGTYMYEKKSIQLFKEIIECIREV